VTADFIETTTAIGSGVAARSGQRDVVRVVGRDAHSYLQGQCTQDLSGIALFESRDALLLSPQGKFEAEIRVTSLGDEELVVDCAPGYGADVLARLSRFKVRIKADLVLETWPAVELRGPDANRIVGASSPSLLAIVVDRPGWQGVDLIGPSAVRPPGIPEGDPQAFEVARIEAGVALMGSELTERVIPEEADVVRRTVSFSKGCYTGQELVARIEARGNNVPRHLLGVVISTDDASGISAGAEIEVDGGPVGSLTSLAWSPVRGAIVALGYVKRGVEVPTSATVASTDGRPFPALISTLPIPHAP
jgi:folate-binding protein YgfZ